MKKINDRRQSGPFQTLCAVIHVDERDVVFFIKKL
jgi:hypothetical protein